MAKNRDVKCKLRTALKEAEDELWRREAALLKDMHTTHVANVINGHEDTEPAPGSLLRTSEAIPVEAAHTPPGQNVASSRVANEIQSLPSKHAIFDVSRHQQQSTIRKRIQCRPLLPGIASLPDNNAYVPLKKNLHVADEKDLKFVPYLGDDLKNERRLFADYEIQQREQRLAHGPPHVRQRKEALIDLTLQHYGIDSSISEEETNILTVMLATLTKSTVETVSSRLELASDKLVYSRGNIIPNVQTEADVVDDGDVNEAREFNKLDDTFRYAKRMNSYRELYCAICYRYDCNTHGVLPKPSLSMQFDESMRKAPATRCIPVPSSNVLLDTFDLVTELSEAQEDLCGRLFSIFQGDVAKISQCIRAPLRLVESFVTEQGLIEPNVLRLDERQDKKDSSYYSVKNYRSVIKVLDSIDSKRQFPIFTPCNHDGPCAKDVCSCIDDNVFCTAACICVDCSNLFRGCCCRGSCSGRLQCTCLSMGRECDPTLCRCGTCYDPPNQPILRKRDPTDHSGQRCLNDNLKMSRHVQLLVGKSEISGWGCFNKFGLDKGDFVGEYCGEVISHDEAERRGAIADEQGKSYIFNMCRDTDIDAKRKGNDIRFMNHSSRPNCRPDILFADGIQRVGVWASCLIPPQTELTINYGTLFKDTMTSKYARKPKRLDD